MAGSRDMDITQRIYVQLKRADDERGSAGVYEYNVKQRRVSGPGIGGFDAVEPNDILAMRESIGCIVLLDEDIVEWDGPTFDWNTFRLKPDVEVVRFQLDPTF